MKSFSKSCDKHPIQFLASFVCRACRFRTRVMYLWGHHLVTQPWAGIRNVPSHLACIFRLDPQALLFVAPGFVSLIVAAARKLIGGGTETRAA